MPCLYCGIIPPSLLKMSAAPLSREGAAGGSRPVDRRLRRRAFGPGVPPPAPAIARGTEKYYAIMVENP